VKQGKTADAQQDEPGGNASQRIHAQHPSYDKREPESGVHVLGFAIPERPVFPGGFDQVYEEILRRQARRFRQDFGHTLEEFSFLLRLPSKAHGDLNKDDVVGARNAEILRIE
jgi:hypothetical protein